MFCIGDLIAQKIIEKHKIDFVRAARGFLIGGTVVGFSLYGWYHKMLPFIFRQFLSKSFSAYPTMTTLALDQIIFAPYMTVVVLYAFSIFEVL